MDTPDYELVKDTAAVIRKDFALTKQDTAVKKNNPAGYEALKKQLAAAIERMMDTNLEKLLHLLYRVDIDERTTHRNLDEHPPEAIPTQLAELVIKREMQKVYTRKLHREGKL
jgi:hypothetical protein